MRTLLVAAVVVSSAFAAPPPPITAVAYHPTTRFLAAGTRGEVILVDATKAEVLGRISGIANQVTGLAFSKDGKQLAVSSGEVGKSGTVRVYDVPDTGVNLTGKPPLTGPKDVNYGLVFSPDGKRLAAAGYDRVIRIWDPASGALSLELKDHSDTINALSFSVDGKLLASAASDRSVKVWDTATGKRLYTLGDSTDWVYSVVWHPDGKHLAAAGVDKSIRVWQADATGGRLVTSVFAHTEAISRLTYSVDGSALYSLSEGKGLKRWDTAKMSERLLFPKLPETGLAMAVRPDGKQLAIGRYDGVLQLIDTETGKTTATPLPEKPKPPTLSKPAIGYGARGQTVHILVEGQHLSDDLILTSNVPGVSARIVAGNHSRREVAVTVAADAPIGQVQLATKTDAGAGTVATFIIDRFPVVADASSIDSARQALPIRLPATVAGAIDRAGQADYFRFTGRAGQEIGVQLVASTIGSKLEPILDVTAEDGRVLASSANGLIAFTCPADGTFAIGVRDREFRGGDDQFYRLHIGNIPIVTAVSPMGVQRGTEATVRLIGAHLPKQAVTIKVPADAPIGSRVPLDLGKLSEPLLGDASIVVGEFPQVSVALSAATIATPGTADGVIASPGDEHRVRFSAKKGQPLIIEVNGRRLGSPIDSFIELLDGAGKPVGRATLRCTARSFVTFRDHDSATAGIRLETWNELSMRDYVYLGNELLRIHQLPLNPDADCNFVAVGGQRVGFLDTTPSHHPNGAPLYKVEIHPPGATFSPNGMPVFRLTYKNDDGGPGYGKDSRITFDPPADGEYSVRVTDARGMGGPSFGYRLTVRPPRPDFSLSVNGAAPNVWKGGAVPIGVTINRVDGYEGPVQVRLENVPSGFEAPATSIEAQQLSTTFALYAKPTTISPAANQGPMRLVASAMIDGKLVSREASIAAPKVVEPGDLVTVVSVDELNIKPGAEAKMTVKIERRNGFKGRVPLEVRGLPYGVRVLDVGLNGILITERDTEREVVIYAEPWVEPGKQPFVVLSRREGKNTEHAARSTLLTITK